MKQWKTRELVLCPFVSKLYFSKCQDMKLYLVNIYLDLRRF